MPVIPTNRSSAHPTVIAFPFSIYATVHRTVPTDTTKTCDYAQQVRMNWHFSVQSQPTRWQQCYLPCRHAWDCLRNFADDAKMICRKKAHSLLRVGEKKHARKLKLNYVIRFSPPQTKQASANAQTHEHTSSKLPPNEIRLNAKLMEQDDEALNSVALKHPLSSTPCCLQKRFKRCLQAQSALESISFIVYPRLSARFIHGSWGFKCSWMRCNIFTKYS